MTQPSARVLSGLAALALLAGPVQAAKYKIHWLIGHPNIDYFEEAAQSFKKTVEAGSHGQIKVVVETAKNPWEDSGAGIPGAEIAEAVAKGEAEMGHSFTDVIGSMDHRFWAFDLPFLFKDYRHLEDVIEGPVGNQMLAGLDSHDMVGLAFTFSGGANVVYSPDRQIRSPEDLKGLRVAVFGDDVDKIWLTRLGAIPVQIRHRDDNINALMKSRSIDAAVTTWRRQYRLGSLKAFHFASLEGASYLVSVTYINRKFFDSLPPEYRKLITDSARQAGRIERAKTVGLNDISKRRLLGEGETVVTLTPENRRKFDEALRPVYADALEPLVGKDLIESIRKAGADDGRVSMLTRP